MVTKTDFKFSIMLVVPQLISCLILYDRPVLKLLKQSVFFKKLLHKSHFRLHLKQPGLWFSANTCCLSNLDGQRRPKNLKENQRPGCFKCKRKCDLCNNFLKETDCFRSFSTGRSYKIKQEINCGTTNIIYLISCKKCNVQYVGSTSTEFKVHFRNHKSAMLTDKKVCEMAVHFNENKHEFKDLEFVAIEKVDL